MNLEMSSFEPIEGKFILSGECPHCGRQAAFTPVTSSFHEQSSTKDRWIAALRCVSCRDFILGIIGFGERRSDGSATLGYLQHYPVGKPNDTVSTDVPSEIRADFMEALRCLWIKAYKATVLMCRRALEASCDKEKAVGRDLLTQIDDLASKQRITEALKRMAHRVRLLGNVGAHGDYSDLDHTITAKDADDAITFMYHYLEHVYVLPARLDDGIR